MSLKYLIGLWSYDWPHKRNWWLDCGSYLSRSTVSDQSTIRKPYHFFRVRISLAYSIASQPFCCLSPLLQRVVKKCDIIITPIFRSLNGKLLNLHRPCCLDYLPSTPIQLTAILGTTTFSSKIDDVFVMLEEAWWKMISGIHWFFNINVHDNHSQIWRENRNEKIGHLHNRFEERKSEKSVYKIHNCRVNAMISVPIYNRDRELGLDQSGLRWTEVVRSIEPGVTGNLQGWSTVNSHVKSLFFFFFFFFFAQKILLETCFWYQYLISLMAKKYLAHLPWPDLMWNMWKRKNRFAILSLAGKSPFLLAFFFIKVTIFWQIRYTNSCFKKIIIIIIISIIFPQHLSCSLVKYLWLF